MRVTLFASITVAATVFAAGCSGSADDGGHAAEAAPPIPVLATEATVTELPTSFEVGGLVRAKQTAAIASRILAPVVDVHVRAGDRVNRGAILVSLDAREMSANAERAGATAAAANEALLAADSDVAAAEAAVALARATHRRIADLADRKSATPQERDQANATLASAEAQLRGAQARRSAAASTREAAAAATAVADTARSYATLTAPFAGIVTERTIDPGAMATPGAALLTLDDATALQVEARIDEARAALVRVGQTVEVSLRDSGGLADTAWVEARLTEIARIDPSSHAFRVKADLAPDTRTQSGAFARTRFTTGSRNALAIPSSALVRRGQLAFVFAIDANAVARLRAVSPGITFGDWVEVLSGLVAGEKIAVDPPPALTDGRAVQLTTAARGASR